MLRRVTQNFVTLGLLLAVSLSLSLFPRARGRSLPGRPEVPSREQAAKKSSVDKEPLGVEISFPKTLYKPLEPIKAILKLKNNSDKKIFLQIHINRYAAYEFDVFDIGKNGNEQPTKTPKTYYHKKSIEQGLGFVSKGNVNIKPNETHIEELNINMVSDMTALTKYSVVAVVPYWLQSARVPDGKAEVRSDAVEVEVRSY